MKSHKLLMLLALAGMATLLAAPASAQRDKDNENKQDKPKEKQERGKSESHRQDNKNSQGHTQQTQSTVKKQDANRTTQVTQSNRSQGNKDRSTVTTRSNSTEERSKTPPWKSPNSRTDSRDNRTSERQVKPTTTTTFNSDRMRRSDTSTSNDNQRSRTQSSFNNRDNNRDSNHRNYNRANRYGGLWFSAGTHSNWDRNRRYSYNNHQYRWYDGGWLIIDAGYTPDFTYSNRSIEMRVQIALADRGYYRGPIDGDIGYGSRSAIARFQDEHRMRVTGRINDSLLSALDL